MVMDSNNSSDNYACHTSPQISKEQFIPEHVFSYLVAGTMTVFDSNGSWDIQAGEYIIYTRNSFGRYIKSPPPGGDFKTISIFLNQEFLRGFSKEYGYVADGVVDKPTVIKLNPEPLLANFVQSVQPYLHLKRDDYNSFLSLKMSEVTLILLKQNPALKNILFDFSDPGKIDLEQFMNRNFRFNVSMERFGYLAGRSLTTFKRDFERIFHSSPGRWLLDKRLTEAHHLITEEHQKPSEVYLQVGFEDITHFSYAFKKKYGVSPSQLKKSA
ncbi:hypothetical protein GCM10023149_06020 [Mucilaginibacter gynuensis]|uniref:HTH araC/xylS-type domain-containing protein n=1 Tax=Mucilaginibacter gynuensis TaxID=1302236 RepID=A0ABP8FUS9_9SPHI